MENLRDVAALLNSLAGEEYCYMTTTGRITGKPHEIEIWFGVMDDKLYLLSGGGEKSDWVKNLKKAPAVTVRIGKRNFIGNAKIQTNVPKDAPIRKLMAHKYNEIEGGQLSKWARTALPVEIDLHEVK